MCGGAGALARAFCVRTGGRDARLSKIFLNYSSQSRRHRRSRILILQMQFNQWSGTKPQARRVRLRKRLAQQSIEQKLGFEIRTGRRELNLAHALAKIESFTLPSWLAEQPLQPSPQVCGLADVWFAVAAQQENRRGSRDLLKEIVAVIPRECECARQHKLIVMMPVALPSLLEELIHWRSRSARARIVLQS